jgi:hypothetical protein
MLSQWKSDFKSSKNGNDFKQSVIINAHEWNGLAIIIAVASHALNIKALVRSYLNSKSFCQSYWNLYAKWYVIVEADSKRYDDVITYKVNDDGRKRSFILALIIAIVT